MVIGIAVASLIILGGIGASHNWEKLQRKKPKERREFPQELSFLILYIRK